MKATNYVKVRYSNGTWEVWKNQVSWKSFDYKNNAVKQARELAKASRPSQLIVNKKDGSLSEVQSYD